MPMTVFPPVEPFRGTRGFDSWGSGNFGASRDGGARRHNGLDFVSVLGDIVVSPISGVLTHIGIAYDGSTLGSIHVIGVDENEGVTAKLLYLAPDHQVIGRIVRSRERLGTAQDVSGYWAKKNPEHAGAMKNHVHLELSITNPTIIDPALYLPPNLVVKRDLTT